MHDNKTFKIIIVKTIHMKNHWQFLVFLSLILLQGCKTQQNVSTNNSIPKIENHTKGKLEIKVAPFGLDNIKITVGQILADGSIHFKWNNIDLNTIDNSELYMSSIKRIVGMSFCHEKQIETSSKTVKAVKTQLALYSNGKSVGFLYPATQKEIQHNTSLNRHSSLVLGSYLSWVYSDGDGDFKAMCKVNMESGSIYSFKEVTNYDIKLKTGWNIIKHTLVEKEDWKSESGQGSFPKTITKTSITDIPDDINWYVNYIGE